MCDALQKEMEKYAADLATALSRSSFTRLAEIGALLLQVKEQGGKIFLIGNGGSAATASHLTNDLVKGCRIGAAPGFKAFCLGDSTSLITCLANDFSYADIYSILLQTYAARGDMVIAFSGSGNSPNIIKALTTAREMGLTTVGFGGRDGGNMKALCDYILIAPTDSMEAIEDLHLIYGHALACGLRSSLAQQAGITLEDMGC